MELADHLVCESYSLRRESLYIPFRIPEGAKLHSLPTWVVHPILTAHVPWQGHLPFRIAGRAKLDFLPTWVVHSILTVHVPRQGHFPFQIPEGAKLDSSPTWVVHSILTVHVPRQGHLPFRIPERAKLDHWVTTWIFYWLNYLYVIYIPCSHLLHITKLQVSKGQLWIQSPVEIHAYISLFCFPPQVVQKAWPQTSGMVDTDHVMEFIFAILCWFSHLPTAGVDLEKYLDFLWRACTPVWGDNSLESRCPPGLPLT